MLKCEDILVMHNIFFFSKVVTFVYLSCAIHGHKQVSGELESRKLLLQ